MKNLLGFCLIILIFISGSASTSLINDNDTPQENILDSNLNSDQGVERRLLVVSKVFGYIYYFNPTYKLSKTRHRDQFLMDLVKAALYNSDHCDFINDLNNSIRRYTNTACISNIRCHDFSGLIEEDILYKSTEKYLYWKHIGPGRDQSRYSRIPGGFKSQLIRYSRSELILDTIAPVPDSIYKYWLDEDYIISLKHSVSNSSYRSKFSSESISNKSLNLSNYLYRVSNLIFLYSNLKFFQANPELNEISLDTILLESIKLTRNDSNSHSFYNTLKSISNKLNDCHASVLEHKSSNTWLIPYTIELVENVPVVTGVCKSLETPITVGDRVVSINNVPAIDLINENLKKVSGCSENYRMMIATLILRTFNSRESVKIDYINKEGKLNSIMQEKIKFPTKGIECRNPIYPDFAELDSNIYYLNMSKISNREIKKTMPLLTSSKGIIFDIRGYLTTESIFYHLTDSIIYSDSFIAPILYFPDSKLNKSIDVELWEIIPKKPSLSGIPKVFITNEYALSYSDSWMSIISQNSFGVIIGSNTAACSGNFALMKLPCKMKFSYTAVKVVTKDGYMYQGIGTNPNIYISRSITDVQGNKDPLILKALMIIKR
jgi:hypothetical protein